MTELAKSIAEAKCLGSLVAIDTAHKAGDLTDAEKDRLLSGLVPLHEEHNREVAELVRQVCEPAGPPLLFRDGFANGLDPKRWRARTKATGHLVWGQKDKNGNPMRAGTYRDAPRHDADGLHFDLRPDREGMLNPAGRPCFEVQYVSTEGLVMLPRLVRVEIDVTWKMIDGGFWCPGWLKAVRKPGASGPSGTDLAEPDMWEWMGVPAPLAHHDQVVGATHLHVDGRGLVLNAQSELVLKTLKPPRNHWVPKSLFEGRHTQAIQIERSPQDPRHLLITREINGQVPFPPLDTFDLQRLGHRVDTVLDTVAGWWFDSCTQVSKKHDPKPGLVLPDAMQLHEIRVWDLTGEATR